MARYEFSFVVTDVELSEEVRKRVGRAVALAAAAELGNAVPPEAATAPAIFNESLIQHWIGIPAVIEFAEELGSRPDPLPSNPSRSSG